MSRNIKEIGKELMGKSLNSYHRKTGLTQLEENNKMQDGILDGILSQVDDAYIEKTEQSNVIHLDGSGDGVVVLDSIEGNTMVNHINSQSLRDWTYSHITYTGQYANTQEFSIDWSKEVSFNCWLQARNDSNPIFYTLKPNTDYTVWINILENNPTLDGVPVTNVVGALQLWINGYQAVRKDLPINTTGWVSFNYRWTREDNSINYSIFGLSISGTNSDGTKTINGGKLRISKEVIVLEGVDKPLDSYFEGLQSSFEEKVNDEGKYEIEILMNNENLFDTNNIIKDKYWSANNTFNDREGSFVSETYVRVKEGMLLTSISNSGSVQFMSYDENKKFIERTNSNKSYIVPSGVSYMRFSFYDTKLPYGQGKIVIGNNVGTFIPQKQNKIKLLLDEPLRSLPNGVKDRLCIKGGKLVVEKNVTQVIIDDKIEWNNSSWNNDDSKKHFFITASRENFRKYLKYDIVDCLKSTDSAISDKMLCRSVTLWTCDERMFAINGNDTYDLQIGLLKSELSQLNAQGVKTYFTNNPMKLCIQCKEPVYEEVLNEYGEPIILEGYENGTLYIDSTIVPTTTVRYTPKMESFKTLKEVENNNIMLTNDVNDNIIPYMMDVDLMIMEKEMALMSHKNIRKMEVLDMTSMQKRTQDMLERLIKGKTLTEQECKTRVTTYLHAGKITDEQAEELMLLIDEVYA